MSCVYPIVSDNTKETDMKQEIEEFINLNDRFKDLNIDSGKQFYILPENIEKATSSSEFIFSDTAITIEKIFKSNMFLIVPFEVIFGLV